MPYQPCVRIPKSAPALGAAFHWQGMRPAKIRQVGLERKAALALGITVDEQKPRPSLVSRSGRLR